MQAAICGYPRYAVTLDGENELRLEPLWFGQYLLLRKIKEGGMAEVYLARDTHSPSQKIVAIKRILTTVAEDADFRTMFIDEARISASLRHEHIAQMLEFGEIDGAYFFAMEYISGKDLRSIQRLFEGIDEMVPLDVTLFVASRACAALDYAHTQRDDDGQPMNVVHRDVSLSNVLVSYSGSVKLIDFGIAKATSRLTRTQAGKLKGKVAYMAPEQIDGSHVDHRADIFSLGIVLYELLTHKRPFDGKGHLEVIDQLRNLMPPPPSTLNPEVPLELDRILACAMSKDLSQRYASAAAMGADVDAFLRRYNPDFGQQQLASFMARNFAAALDDERTLLQRVAEISPQSFPHPQRNQDTGVQLLPFDEAPESISGEMEAADISESLDFDRPVNDDPFAPRPGPPVAERDQPTVITAAAPDGRFADSTGAATPAPTAVAVPRHSPSVPVDRSAISAASTQAVADEAIVAEHTDPRPLDAVLAPSAGQATVLSNETPRPSRQIIVTAGQSTMISDDAPTPRPAAPLASASAAPQPPPAALTEQPRSTPPRSRPAALTPGPTPIRSAHAPFAGTPAPPAAQLSGWPPAASTPPALVPQQQHVAPAAALRREPVTAATRLPVSPRRRRLLMLLGSLIVLPIVVVVGSLLTGKSAPHQTSANSGSVVVTTAPAAACAVSIDGRPGGLLSPGEPMTLTGVAEGTHRIELQCAGFQDVQLELTVERGKVAIVEARLSR